MKRINLVARLTPANLDCVRLAVEKPGSIYPRSRKMIHAIRALHKMSRAKAQSAAAFLKVSLRFARLAPCARNLSSVRPFVKRRRIEHTDYLTNHSNLIALEFFANI